jgi:hypothetical protein
MRCYNSHHNSLTIITMSRIAILAEAGDTTAFANDIAQAAD